MTSSSLAAQYMKVYIEQYRSEYQRLTGPQPGGGGYPKLPISPYLDSKFINVYLAIDGAAIADFSAEPPSGWEIAGGPALIVDYANTRTPSSVQNFRKRLGGNLGLCRVVSKDGFENDVWNGRLPVPKEVSQAVTSDGTEITVESFDLSWVGLIRRLTFGAFGQILDLHLPELDTEFWNSRVIRDLGFLPADLSHKRFFHYLELLRHVDSAAWDARSLWVRVPADVRRDFAGAFARIGKLGGFIDFRPAEVTLEPFYDRLYALGKVIDQFAAILRQQTASNEQVFHSFLKQNPVLLDLYSEVESKPRWRYPQGESPLGKAYVEPDFVLKRPDGVYTLVELERADKQVTTRGGRPSSGVTQPAFQLSEWVNFIENHYPLLGDRYPGINIEKNRRTMIVMSRTTNQVSGTGNARREIKNILRGTYRVDDILTYDDLLERASHAFTQLTSLAPSSAE